MLAAAWQIIQAFPLLLFLSLWCFSSVSLYSSPALMLPHTACSLTLRLPFLLSLWGVKLYNHSCCKPPLISLVLFFFCCAVSRTASCWKYVSPSPPIDSWCVISSWHHHHVHFFFLCINVGPNPPKLLPLSPFLPFCLFLCLSLRNKPIWFDECF